MVRLEDLERGSVVEGVIPEEAVSVQMVDWITDTTLKVIFKGVESGELGEATLYRSDEPKLGLLDAKQLWSFEGEGALFRLVMEAKRLKLAHLFDPFVAVHTSKVEPLPHQIQAVYGCMLPRQPLRFLLADDPGAGKTIMAGLYMKELIIRGDLKRCLIIAPGSLVDNWQAELLEKFEMDLPILANDMLNRGNPFEKNAYMIAKMHHMAWRDDLIQLFENAPPYDAIIVDEAHKMSAYYQGEKLNRTSLYKLGMAASERTRDYILMTATPHSGYHENFQLFLQLLDSDRFEGKYRQDAHNLDTSDIMRRMVKEKLVKMDGTPLFPPRQADTVKYQLSPEEHQLYERVTTYVKTEMNRAQRVLDPSKKNVVGFALTMLQRRLASSPHAIYQSIKNRRARLDARIEELKAVKDRPVEEEPVSFEVDLSDIDITDEQIEEALEDPDALSEEDEEELADRSLDAATAARTIPELEAEIETLTELEALAKQLVAKKVDKKWEHLAELLQSEKMTDADGTQRRVIVFTEHRATLDYLHKKIASLFGDPESVVVIHGGKSRRARLKAKEQFWHGPKSRVLLGTDAAGEGINLHCANIVINYDLPWNPNRLEQRFGRVHRIGQERKCFMWNLVAENTREGYVFDTLIKKIKREKKALEGQVFDVLGKAFEGRPLRNLYLKAIQSEDDASAERAVEVDLDAITAEVEELLQEHATALKPGLSEQEMAEIEREMEAAEANKLQPHFISSFFREAFSLVAGEDKIRPREEGRYEIKYVPYELTSRGGLHSGSAPILDAYSRVTFEKDKVEGEGYGRDAALIAPGHPLLGAVIDLTLDRYGKSLQQGAVLVDPTDEGDEPRMLLAVEHTIQDARKDSLGQRRVASKEFNFLELEPDGELAEMGPAPYLDYEPIENVVEDEGIRGHISSRLDTTWIDVDWQDKVRGFAQSEIAPSHIEKVRSQREARVDKTMRLVKDRLDEEMSFWGRKKLKYQQKAQTNEKYKGQVTRAQQKWEELKARKEERLQELEQEKHLIPQEPRIVAGALVVPQGLVDQLVAEHLAPEQELGEDEEQDEEDDQGKTGPERAKDTKTSELAAMARVLEIEEELGNEPKDVSAKRGIGYDIASWTPDGDLRCIEVKARNPDAHEVTFTINELRAGMNKPDEFIVAFCQVDQGEVTDVKYIWPRWKMELNFEATSMNIPIKELLEDAEEPA